jgi:hypothetical protein
MHHVSLWIWPQSSS